MPCPCGSGGLATAGSGCSPRDGQLLKLATDSWQKGPEMATIRRRSFWDVGTVFEATTWIDGHSCAGAGAVGWLRLPCRKPTSRDASRPVGFEPQARLPFYLADLTRCPWYHLDDSISGKMWNFASTADGRDNVWRQACNLPGID